MKEVDNYLSEKCKEVLDEMLVKLNDGLVDETFLNNQCEKHPDCAEELRSVYKTWDKLSDLETPKSVVGHKDMFYMMLEEFEGLEKAKKNRGTITIQLVPLMKWAAVLFLGIFIGVFASRINNQTPFTLSAANRTLLTSLESTSSTERLTALQTIKSIESPEDQVFEAMFQAMTNDPNVNVRLSTIEAMLHFADRPKARAMLIKGLAFQDDPIVQLTLAEVIIKLQEKGAIEELEKILNTNQFDTEVRMHIRETIEML